VKFRKYVVVCGLLNRVISDNLVWLLTASLPFQMIFCSFMQI